MSENRILAGCSRAVPAECAVELCSTGRTRASPPYMSIGGSRVVILAIHFFAWFFSFFFFFVVFLSRLGRRRCVRACSLVAQGQSALRDQVHGAFDWDANRAGVLVNVVVAAERLFFLDPDVVQLTALIVFQSRSRKGALGIVFRNVARVLGSVAHQRAYRNLSGFGAFIEIGVQTIHDEVNQHHGYGQARQEIKHAFDADVAALVVAMLGRVHGMDFVGHNSVTR
jgi:hypothetical protein